MIALQVLVGALAVWAGVRALVGSRGTTSRPWRAYLRGFGAAVLLLVPANLLDFAVSLVVQASGVEARDGLVYAAGYAVANIVLIVTIVRAIRLGADGVPAVPQAFLDAYGITPRERDVVEKLVEGKADRRIAEELYISPRTVDTHLRSVFRKCNVSSRLQLSRLVVSYGELRNTS
jgi:DNA-binding CsgD family transcriptional regulator